MASALGCFGRGPLDHGIIKDDMPDGRVKPLLQHPEQRRPQRHRPRSVRPIVTVPLYPRRPGHSAQPRRRFQPFRCNSGPTDRPHPPYRIRGSSRATLPRSKGRLDATRDARRHTTLSRPSPSGGRKCHRLPRPHRKRQNSS